MTTQEDFSIQATPEPFVTIQVAAKTFGVPNFKVQRAARLGLFPTYTFFNKRKLVRVSEVASAFKAVRHD